MDRSLESDLRKLYQRLNSNRKKLQGNIIHSIESFKSIKSTLQVVFPALVVEGSEAENVDGNDILI